MPPEVRKLPPPVQNHLVHLLPQGLHVGIGKAGGQRDYAIHENLTPLTASVR